VHFIEVYNLFIRQNYAHSNPVYYFLYLKFEWKLTYDEFLMIILLRGYVCKYSHIPQPFSISIVIFWGLLVESLERIHLALIFLS